MPATRPIDPKAISYHKRRHHFIRKRAYAEVFEAAGYQKVAQQLRACEEVEVLACCSHCGKTWWITDRCKLRVCPLCSYKVAQERADFLKAMTRHMQHPKMLTLTMARWTEDPGDGIDHLRAAFNMLRRHKVFKPVIGGAYNIELKPKDNGWHIHMHVMIDAPFMPRQKLYTAWKFILHQSFTEVDIRSASDDKAKEYICKDASKSVSYDLNPHNIVAWYEATKGKRLFATFGKWYNAKIEDLDAEHAPFKAPSVCPFCGAEKTIYFARDGPFIFGNQDWQYLRPTLVGPDGEQRPIALAHEYIDNPHLELNEKTQQPSLF